MAPAAALLLVTLLFAVAPAPSLAKVFRVGDKQGWAPKVNYTTWAEQQQFHVGDWLNFVYQKDMYDMVQVQNETAYAACDASASIFNYSRGTNYAFELNRTGRFYFICSRGYCFDGMKVSVLVHPAALPPAVAPESHKSRAFSSRARAEAGAWLAALAASLGAAVLVSLPFPV
ncbi:hypothetical protein EJB05_16878 [Eragrostis curvula]|uniref:Phytocyanin domain-containing protein n=1 Tax=Eragrostis curvula TaxID=38414 RepID=A0A5J9VG32_9POAL|nr:hypothetical protein EJB05_16878 [Eragrostis curvula]